MNNKGFSLIAVLVLSMVIFLIGGTGLYIASTSFRATRADINLNIAEKAANAGLMNAFDQINMEGSAGNDRTITGTMGQASYLASIAYGGKNVWFISSKGTVAGALQNANVVKTALFQGYYGVGLYTVRGKVNANVETARLSGCDAAAASASSCYVPAFIASGNIDTGRTVPQNCTDNNGSPSDVAIDGTTAGIYGTPGILRLDQGDLSRIFFKVKCFNKFDDSECSISLLDYLEHDYGWNSAHTDQHMSFQQTGTNANKFGIPVVTISALPHPLLASPEAGSCQYPLTTPPLSGLTLNLSSALTSCDEIVLNSHISTITITGSGLRSNGRRVKIYAYGAGHVATFSAASDFILYTDKKFSIQNGSSDFTVYNAVTAGTFYSPSNFTVYTSAPDNTFYSPSDFTVYSTADITFNSPSNFNIYTTGITTLNGTATGTSGNPFRIVSTNTVNVGADAILANGTIITGPAVVTDIDDSSSPQNLAFAGDITMDQVNVFTRRLGFATNSTVNIFNSLVYVYAYACPTCLRNLNTSSIDACTKDTKWCGYFGNGIRLNMGRDSNGNARPVLFISNNTSVRTNISSGTEYIWGVWYGEDVTYLKWGGNANRNIRGFLIRNFPSDLTLSIQLSDRYSFNFSKSVIDAISDRYAFFRKVECVRDPLTPKAQLIQTRMTNY